MRAVRALELFLILAATGFAVGACRDDQPPGHCDGDRCYCHEGENCAIPCRFAPCKVTCLGDNSSCVGDCANGDCQCGPESQCSFVCVAPPCHVECFDSAGCSAECANGTCSCVGASCEFDCTAGPCHVECTDGARCSGVCANGTCSCAAGSACLFRCLDDLCDYDCAGGGPTPCPDGVTVSCGGADCPEP